MLRNAIDNYLNIRRTAGFELKVDEGLLRNFARFAETRGENHVRRQTAIDWAAKCPSASQRDRRLGMVRRFADHARAEDDLHELVPKHLFAGKRKRPIPYIFLLAEVRQLLGATSRLRPKGSLRPKTFYAFFGLLAATGLRVSEARRLLLDDVTTDGLLIRKTKFRKSRLVPLHATTLAAIESYIEQRRCIGGDDDHLFISTNGHALTHAMVNGTFHFLLRFVDLHLDFSQRPPQPRDLRHYFAVSALESCSTGIDDIARHILALSTYLGHAHVTDTYWYLQATPHLMTNIADTCEAFIDGDVR